MSDSLGVSDTLAREPCRTRPLCSISLHHPCDRARVQPGFALGDFAQAFHQHLRLNFARNDGVGAAPEQIERQLLIGFLQHNDETAVRILPEKIGDSVGWIRGQHSFEDHNVSGKFLDGGNSLLETLGLADDPYIVFERENLAQPGAEYGLGIRHNHTDRAFAILRLKAFACLDTNRSADRSTAHPSSFSRPTRRGQTFLYRNSAVLRTLFALKTVLIDDHPDSTPATIFKTTHHSPATIHLHINF